MPKHFKFKELGPSILGVEFTDFHAMALMFMRLQEYTEGLKKHRGVVIGEGDTLINYLKKRSKLYYVDEWAGYNIQGITIQEIWKKYPKTIWNKYESKLFAEIYAQFGAQFDKFHAGQWYVISWMKGDKDTKAHERCHGEFYLNREYRDKIYEVLDKAKIKKALKVLKKMGYYVHLTEEKGKYILYDEINAYSMTDPKHEITDLGMEKKTLKELKKLYKTYVK